MSTTIESSSAVWIEGNMSDAPEGNSGPIVIGPDWMLEMIRAGEGSRTFGLFWAPFSIVHFDTRELRGRLTGEFVGCSMPSPPPADWLTESMIFDLGKTPLATTPEEPIATVQHPHAYTSIETGAHASPLSKQAKMRIAQSYRDGISISEIACGLGVSHAHLTRQFKRDFGLTPLRYCHHLRVQEAVCRLSKGERILDVGFDVGFNDAGRFYQDFRRVTGTSPGKCRTLIKKRQGRRHSH